MFLVFSKKEAAAFLKACVEINDTLPFLKDKKGKGEEVRENTHVKFGYYKAGELTPVELSVAKDAIRWTEEDELFYFEVSEEFSLETISFLKKLNKIIFSLGFAVMGLKQLFASSIENIGEEWERTMGRLFPVKKEEAKKENETKENEEEQEHSYGKDIGVLDNIFYKE
jgi:hypothetical protein